jgi:hypothetical protein
VGVQTTIMDGQVTECRDARGGGGLSAAVIVEMGCTLEISKARKEDNADLFDHIECFDNLKRRHSRIGYDSPTVFETPQ